MDNDGLENPWGEEPAWAEDDEQSSDDKNGKEGDERGEIAHGAQHVMMLVDCRPSMYVPSSDTGISPMDAALMACERLLRLKVHNVAVHKTGKRDGVAFMLYGRPSQEQSTHMLLPLERPGVQHIRTIRQFTEGKSSLKEEYCSTDGDSWENHSTLCPLRTALYEANKTFVQAECVKQRAPSDKGLSDAKSVWIFTNNDDPCAGNEEEQQHLQRVAKDVTEHGLEIHLWPLAKVFRSDFYNTILTTPVVSSVLDTDEMMDRIHREWRKVRTTFSCPMLLPDWRERSDDPGIMIDFYRPVQVQSRPQATTIHQQTKRETEKVTQLVDAETGEVLKSSRDPKHVAEQRSIHRIRTIVEFGSKAVPITKQEVDAIKKQSNANPTAASLILLGFKEKGSLPLHYTVEKSYFLYPNEEAITGSTAAFANLHAAMVRKGVLAIGELLTKVTATSRLVAIFPQQEEVLSEEYGGIQVTPPGMVAVVLPFEDDVRGLEEEYGVASEDSIRAATDLIKHMNYPDVELGLDFKNDALAHFWTYIESVALETTLPSPTDSATQIDEAAVREFAGEQIDAFCQSFPEDIVAEKATKKRKIEPDECGEYDWMDLYRMGSLSQCTAKMLKEFLKSEGAKVGGKKEELVDRASQILGDRITSNTV